ncbi:MAG: hypothetical protein H7296_10470 [Bacteroidia bacterium]|nr:hypothetical protein [Bacteroidia bacterium]
MDSKILLKKILERFKEKGIARVDGYNSFGYIRETENAVFVTRETGKDTPIPFKKIMIGIDAYKANASMYQTTPTALREVGITHVTSPIFALLHLLDAEDYN